MIFSSPGFIFAFLPPVFLVAVVLRRIRSGAAVVFSVTPEDITSSGGQKTHPLLGRMDFETPSDCTRGEAAEGWIHEDHQELREPLFAQPPQGPQDDRKIVKSRPSTTPSWLRSPGHSSPRQPQSVSMSVRSAPPTMESPSRSAGQPGSSPQSPQRELMQLSPPLMNPFSV